MDKKSLTREIITFLILFLLVFIILKSMFYEYTPNSSLLKKKIEYTANDEFSKVIQEITTSDDMNVETNFGHYNINSAELDEYKAGNSYKSGNSNPFKYATEDNAN